MADDLDSIISQATGQPSQTASPASSPASGPSTVDLGDVSSPTPPVSAPPSSQSQDLDSIISQATQEGHDLADSAPSGSSVAPASAVSRFATGVGQGSGLGGTVDAIKQAATQPDAGMTNALDYYHQMVEKHASGDNKAAAQAASAFILNATKLGLTKAYAPFISVAQAVLMDPIKAVQEQRKIDNTSGSALDAAKAQIKSIWSKAKQDWQTGNYDGAATDVLAGTVGQPAMGVVPFIGPAVRSMANNLDADTHNPNGEDVAGILGNAVGALGSVAAGEGLGRLGKALPGAGRATEGLNAGEAGSAAAQTAADTAKAHDTILQGNRDQFQAQLDLALQDAQDKQDAAKTADTARSVETGNTNAEATAAHKDIVTTGRDAQIQAVNDTLDTAKRQYADQFKQALQTQTTGALPPEDLAPKVNEGIDKYEEKSHTDFEEGMNGEGGVIDQLDGHSRPVLGSPFQEKAAQLLKKPVPGDHPLAAGAKTLAGVKLDASVQKYLQSAAEGMQEIEADGPADAAGNPTKIMKKVPMGDLTADQLVQMRQNLREAATQFQRGDLNRRVLGDMINATDNTLEKLAQAADNPDVLQEYEGLRQQYKTARSNLDTSAADKLRLDSPDKALGDVNKYLLQGNNAASKIKVISSMVGDETMQGLRQSYVQQLAEMAPEDAAKQLARIPASVKQEFFGPELDGKLAAAQSAYEKSVQSATADAAARTQYISNAADEAVGRNSVQAKYDRQANTADTAAANKKITDDYNDAKQKAVDISKQQNAPYNTKFASAISDGSIGEKLASDKIAEADVVALKSALDPADFTSIQQGIVNRQMAATTTAGHFNPVKFLDWYDSIPGPTRDAFFSDQTGTPMTLDISGIRDAAKLQQIARLGAIVGGGAAVKLAPGTALKGLFEVLAGATAVSRKDLLVNLLDTVASNPRLLKNMGAAADATKAGLQGADIAAKSMPVLGHDFGKRVRVNGQTGTVLGTHPESGKPFVEWDK